MKNFVSNTKLKIIEESEILYDKFIRIKNLSNILTQYSFDNPEDQELKILSLISILNEKINEYNEEYKILEDLLYENIDFNTI